MFLSGGILELCALEPRQEARIRQQSKINPDKMKWCSWDIWDGRAQRAGGSCLSPALVPPHSPTPPTAVCWEEGFTWRGWVPQEPRLPKVEFFISEGQDKPGRRSLCNVPPNFYPCLSRAPRTGWKAWHAHPGGTDVVPRHPAPRGWLQTRRAGGDSGWDLRSSVPSRCLGNFPD